MRLCTGYFQRNRSRDDHCWWKDYIRYPHIFENRYFLLRFKKKKLPHVAYSNRFRPSTRTHWNDRNRLRLFRTSHIRFCLKTEIFRLRFGLPSTRIRWKRSPKTHLSKTLYREEIFENAANLSTCGRTKTEIFKYDDVINYILITLRIPCEGS